MRMDNGANCVAVLGYGIIKADKINEYLFLLSHLDRSATGNILFVGRKGGTMTWIQEATKRLDACIKKQKARKFPYVGKAWYGYKPCGLLGWYKANEHKLPLDFTEKETSCGQ